MKWLKQLFATNYVVKPGFLEGKSGVLEPARLFIYNNGTLVVGWAGIWISVAPSKDGINYETVGLNRWAYTRFIVTE